MINLKRLSSTRRICGWECTSWKLPSKKRNRATGEWFANKVGTFLDYDDSDIWGWTKSIRVWWTLDIFKPLQKGRILTVEGKAKWIQQLKHKRLPRIWLETDQGAHIYLDSQARSASLLYTFMPHLLPTPSLPPNLPLDPASPRERESERAERGRAEREEEETQQCGTDLKAWDLADRFSGSIYTEPEADAAISGLGRKVVKVVREYVDAQDKFMAPSGNYEWVWKSPSLGTWKENFDALNLNGADHGWGSWLPLPQEKEVYLGCQHQRTGSRSTTIRIVFGLHSGMHEPVRGSRGQPANQTRPCRNSNYLAMNSSNGEWPSCRITKQCHEGIKMNAVECDRNSSRKTEAKVISMGSCMEDLS
ncbi:hypothetical protein Cgig2_026593 [Carnegiea gigantea]|uniref:Uncharacterized protein n=1 Tax=Carnegiea gigantea TaxID=171969 RepID=A0A9Q1QJR0_9CARY|nr:hypothetical protein Cgig2_026593 [Carnegiea gigantea]